MKKQKTIVLKVYQLIMEKKMSVAKIIEVSASSSKSFEKAMENGIENANDSLQNITGAWIESQKVIIKDGKIDQYRVIMKISFVLK